MSDAMLRAAKDQLAQAARAWARMRQAFLDDRDHDNDTINWALGVVDEHFDSTLRDEDHKPNAWADVDHGGEPVRIYLDCRGYTAARVPFDSPVRRWVRVYVEVPKD